MKKVHISILLVVLGVLASYSLAGAALWVAPMQLTTTPQSGNMLDVLTKDGRFTNLVRAINAAGLNKILTDPYQQLTLFAPTDVAFGKLPPGLADALLANPAQLTGTLFYHIVAGKFTAAELVSFSSARMNQIQSQQGGLLTVIQKDGKVLVNGNPLIVTDIPTSNGIIHVLEGVLLPSTVALPSSTATIIASATPARTVTVAAATAAPTQVLQPTGVVGTYVVQRGDWLRKIAQKTGVSVEKLLELNPWLKKRPNWVIYAGEVLVLGGALPTPPPATALPTRSVATVQPTAVAGGRTYVVQKGDWVYQIARTFGVSPQQIYQLNPWLNQRLNGNVYPGEVLRLP